MVIYDTFASELLIKDVLTSPPKVGERRLDLAWNTPWTRAYDMSQEINRGQAE